MRKSLQVLPWLLGLLIGLAASTGSAQKVTYTSGPICQVGYAEVEPDSGSPFVPEKSPTSAPPSPANQVPFHGLVDDSKSAGELRQPDTCDVGTCSCGSCGCDNCRGCCADCDACPSIGSVIFAGMESFRGIVDGDYQNNNGMVVGGNVGVPLPKLSDYGFGGQFGASYGAYDLNGRTSINNPVSPSTNPLSDVQQQIFITTGIFHRATCKCPINMAVGYDWMINDAYSVYGVSPHLGQWRGQLGYCLNACNELGVWTALHDHRDVKGIAGFGDISFRGVNQTNFFWHHNYDSGADSWMWMGFPDDEKLGGGRLGELTLGMTLNVPLTEKIGLYANGQYMKPTAGAGPVASIEVAYSIGFGLAFYPHGSSKTSNVAGNCWMPVLPVANNGSFLVDTTGIPP